jgi:hypothetical protein
VYKNTARRAAGYAISTGPAGSFEGDTQNCQHCGMHWLVKPGSGTVRGFCTKCMGLTCGARACHECVPMEKRLDLYERGKLIGNL